MTSVECVVEHTLPQPIFGEVVRGDAFERRVTDLACELDHQSQIFGRPLDLALRGPQPHTIADRGSLMKPIAACVAPLDQVGEHAARVIEIAKLDERAPENQCGPHLDVVVVVRAGPFAGGAQTA